jgi:hypothetical protein
VKDSGRAANGSPFAFNRSLAAETWCLRFELAQFSHLVFFKTLTIDSPAVVYFSHS